MIATCYIFMKDGKFCNFQRGIFYSEPLYATLYNTKVEMEKRRKGRSFLNGNWVDNSTFFEVKELVFHLVDVR